MKNIYLIILISLMYQSAFAKELARPNSIGGDYLLELNTGLVDEDNHKIYEVGFEVERFTDSFKHHCAIGLSFEATDLDDEIKYFAGGLVSFYYHHFKLFVSSGILLGSNDFKEWKTRYGFGREFFIKKDYIIIPAFTVDRLGGGSHPGFNIGIAKEF